MRVARRFLTLLIPYGLKPTTMHPAFGMSEISSETNSNHQFTLETTSDTDQFVSVGPPYPGNALLVLLVILLLIKL